MIRNAATGRSVLVPAGENLLSHTDLSNATYWTGTQCTITPNAGTAPDGTNTAYLITDTVTGAVAHRVEWNGVGGAIPHSNRIQCFSCYFKPGTLTAFALRAVGNGWSNKLDFSSTPTIVDGSILAGGPSSYDWWTSVGIQDAGNGWYRCWTSAFVGVSGNGPTPGNINTIQRFLILNGATSYTGTGTGTCYLWGPQVNNGIFPTDYRANTTGAAVGTPQRQPISLPNVVTAKPTIVTRGLASRVNDDAPLQLSIAASFLYDAIDYNPSEGIAPDRSGNARHGTPQSAARAKRGNGIAGRATMKFGALSNQAIVVPATSFDQFTLWIVAKCTGSNGCMVTLTAAGFPDGGYLNTTVSSISVQRAGVQVAKGLSTNWGIDNVARSIIVTYGGSLATLNMYIGGVLQSMSTTASGTMAAGNVSQPIYIGATDAGAQAVNMECGIVGFYPGVITATDIANLSAHSLAKWGV